MKRNEITLSGQAYTWKPLLYIGLEKNLCQFAA